MFHIHGKISKIFSEIFCKIFEKRGVNNRGRKEKMKKMITSKHLKR